MRRNFRSVVVLVLLGAACCQSLHAAKEEGLLRTRGEWQPYLERIDPRDFAVMENTLRVTESETSAFTLYRVSRHEVGSFLSIKQAKDGRYSLVAGWLQGDLQKTEIRLSDDAAKRILASFELALTHQIYPIANRSLASLQEELSGESYWLILDKGVEGKAAGLVPSATCIMGLDYLRPFLDLVYQLQRYSAREAEISELNLAISQLRESYPH